MQESGVALRMEGVSKAYPGTLAVQEIDLTVYPGEVHALVGENGAGKSTLMKIIAGAFSDYTGKTYISSEEVKLHSPAAAKSLGIEMIHQELSLATPLSIAENILAGRLPSKFGLLDRPQMARETRDSLRQVGLDLDPFIPVEDLSQHEAQLVEIAKALANHPCILVMDEPTSALSREEVARLFTIVKRMRNLGLAIIYISHHLPEIFEIADRVTVLRDGKKVGTYPIREVTSQQLVEKMIGGSLSNLYAQRTSPPGDELLRVDRLSRYGFFHDVSFRLRAGEILGIGGLSGAGRSELGRSLCGIDPVDAGRIVLERQEVFFQDYAQAIRSGLAYLTEDRKLEGLALRLTTAENLLSAVIPRHSRLGLYLGKLGSHIASRMTQALQVYPAEPSREIASLSGGNQQKVLLAKWLATEPRVLILDEPTRGVDVGAKVIIHKAVAELADKGKGVILITSDLPELVGLSDRVLVLRKGHLIGELSGASCTEESVLLAANGKGEFSATTETAAS